jgi:hypothetical protein
MKLRQKSTDCNHIVAIIGVCVVLLVSLAAIFAVAYTHRYIPSKINFQEYEPTYLPTESTITKKMVEVWQASADSSKKDTTVLRLDAGNSISIYEQTDVSGSTGCTELLDDETCSIERTPGGRRYTLTTMRLPDQPTIQGIRWVKNNTNLYMRISSKDGYGLDTINRAVDSFKPVKYDDLPSIYFGEDSF